jgi:hypothetical protein
LVFVWVSVSVVGERVGWGGKGGWGSKGGVHLQPGQGILIIRASPTVEDGPRLRARTVVAPKGRNGMRWWLW